MHIEYKGITDLEAIEKVAIVMSKIAESGSDDRVIIILDGDLWTVIWEAKEEAEKDE